jgi:hypothetical protein
MQNTSAIPKIFQKSEGGLLESCIMCKSSLVNPPQDYLIEKAFRIIPEFNRKEVIFEYAMCFVCAEQMRNELSAESKQRIENYFKNNIDFQKRHALLQPDRSTFPNWIKECMVSGESIKEAKEYSLYAHAFGKKLVYDIFPYAISGTAMEEVNELISEKTRDILDDFIRQHFSGPPEVAEILKKRPVLV